MNSKETLTCYLFHLPQDIFRVIFQYLSLYELLKIEEAFLNNQELLSHYRSSLQGFTLTEKITISYQHEKLISWIIDRKLLVGKLELCDLSKIVMDLLNHIRYSLKTIDFSEVSPLGHFPSLISALFYNSRNFTSETLLSFFCDNPQLETVRIDDIHYLSNEILPLLSNSCPKIKILSLSGNNCWVDDETMSLLTEQRLFPNLKSLNIRGLEDSDEESLRQFILSRPLLCGLYLPNDIHYSKDFLVFYFRQVIFPSILSQNNNNDLESHSLAISSIGCFVIEEMLDERDDVVIPEIFSVDILSHFYHKDFSKETLYELTEVFCHLSKFPSMIDSILQSQFIPFILNDTSPCDYLSFFSFVDFLFRCGVFHEYFPLLVEKYRTHPSYLIAIICRAIYCRLSLLTKEELQTMIPIVLNELFHEGAISNCLLSISTLLQEPSSQYLVDPHNLLLLLSINLFKILIHDDYMMIECLKRFLSVNENYQQLFIESNLLPHIMTGLELSSLIDFTIYCLFSSGDGLLVDHLVDIKWFENLITKYSQSNTNKKKEIESIFKRLIEFKNNKYSEIVREMELPNELRVKLFEKGEERS